MTRTIGRLILACLWCMAGIAAAEYPERPIKIVVPFAPGGGLDIIARIVGTRLSESVKQPVIVENRVGAGTTIGANYVAKSAPDGYTLLLALESIAVSPSTYANLPFDPVRDFEPITLVNVSYWVFVANPSLPVNSLKEFIAYAKDHPGKLNYASTGTGGNGHLSMEELSRLAGIRMTHIPYAGGAPAATALLGGQVDVMLLVGPLALPHLRSGKLRPLAMTGSVRASAFPAVPTFAEEGFPGFDSGGWTALLAPRGTPREIVLKLNTEVRRIIEKVVTGREFGQFYVEDFQVPRGNTPEEMAAIMRNDVAKWRGIAKTMGFTPQ